MTAMARRIGIFALAIALTVVAVVLFGFSSRDELCSAYREVKQSWSVEFTDTDDADSAANQDDISVDTGEGEGPDSTAHLADIAQDYRSADVRDAGRKIAKLPEWHDGDDFASVAFPIGAECQ